MHQPTTEHWGVVKWLIRYLHGTLNLGIVLHRNSLLMLHAFSDVDWAGNKDGFTSTGVFIIYLGRNPISWSSKKQRSVARSSTKAEYRSVVTTAAEVRWICSLLTELGIHFPQQPVIYCDNVQSGILRVAHVSSANQLAGAFTKPLPRTRFQLLLDNIGLSSRRTMHLEEA